MSKRALALGCGGVAGAAWSIAVLEELERQLGWDARDADTLIGTSAGAVLAVLLATGVDTSSLVDCQIGSARSCVWAHDRDSGGRLPPWPAMRPTSLALTRQALRDGHQPLAAVAGLLPAGRTDMEPFRRLIDHVLPEGGWPQHPRTWLVAVDCTSGRRTAFGRADAPPADARDAVCASYGVPGWCPPITIGDRRYIDGGAVSPASADLLCDTDTDDVIILAPMASRERDTSRHPLVRAERRMRRHMTAILDRECAQLRHSGKRVIRLEPCAQDLSAFGYNMMDPSRRHHVFSTARRSAPALVTQAIRQLH